MAGVTVLVVEDESLLLFTIADDLRDAGYQVIEATNAAAALLMFEGDEPVDVLFTDIDMPGPMNGIGLANTVHARWPAARIVMTSGHVTIADRDVPAGGRFVPKPYTLRAVVAAIEAVIG
jgi:CheY-like chemotaxis protein